MTNLRPHTGLSISSVRTTLALAALLSLLAPPVRAALTWENHYGGDYNDWGNDAIQTHPDDGYLITGVTHSYGPGAPDRGAVYLVKIDPSGQLQWSTAYGGTDTDMAGSEVIQAIPDWGFVIAGSKTITPTDTDAYLLKTDYFGHVYWSRTYGAPGVDGFTCVRQVTGGNYICAGMTTPGPYPATANIYLVKTNGIGDTLWTRSIGDHHAEAAAAVEQIPDGYALGGTSTDVYTGERHLFLLRTDPQGYPKLYQTYGPGGETGGQIVVIPGSGYALFGTTNMIPPNELHLLLLRLGEDGHVIWQHTYGTPGLACEGYAIKATADGGFIMAGLAATAPGRQGVYLVKTNSSGDVEWTSTYGGAPYYTREAYGVLQARDGGYLAVGIETGVGPGWKVYAIKTDQNGLNEVPPSLNAKFAGVPSPLRITSPFTGWTQAIGREAEHFLIYDASGRIAGICPGSAIGRELAPGVYFVKPRDGQAPAERIVKLR